MPDQHCGDVTCELCNNYFPDEIQANYEWDDTVEFIEKL